MARVSDRIAAPSQSRDRRSVHHAAQVPEGFPMLFNRQSNSISSPIIPDPHPQAGFGSEPLPADAPCGGEEGTPTGSTAGGNAAPAPSTTGLPVVYPTPGRGGYVFESGPWYRLRFATGGHTSYPSEDGEISL